MKLAQLEENLANFGSVSKFFSYYFGARITPAKYKSRHVCANCVAQERTDSTWQIKLHLFTLDTIEHLMSVKVFTDKIQVSKDLGVLQ